MANQSKLTVPVAFRLPVEYLDLLKSRAKKQGLSLSDYVKGKIIYDALRKH